MAAGALVVPLAAEAKFTLRLDLEPARPIAKQPVRVIVRTSEVLPKEQGLRLHVVGPWREGYGQAFFEPRLRRTTPRAFVARIRFPHAGRWRLIVPNWGVPGSAWPAPIDRAITIRPAR